MVEHGTRLADDSPTEAVAQDGDSPSDDTPRSPSTPAATVKDNRRLALEDILTSLRRYEFWISLGWNDILQRYRGSVLGPLWLTLTTGIFVAGLGPLYAMLFGLNAREYLPSMAIGIVCWTFITGCINECCRAFIDTGPIMKQTKLPWTMHVLHITWRNIIIFAHSAPIIAIVMVYAQIPLTSTVLLALPGLVLLTLNLIWVGLILAVICARFRDVVPIVTSILMLAFFLSPVIWNPSMQRVPAWVLYVNPFAALIEIVRAPLLGAPPGIVFVVITGFGAVLGSVAAVALFARYRKTIVYWV